MDESIIGARLVEIARLEAAVDGQLPDRRKTKVTFGWREAATAWAAAIWNLARVLGPVNHEGDAHSRYRAATKRPIFICGAHRSGTTLLRDLLDGHPLLTVLPSEPTFFAGLEPKFGGLRPADFADACGQEWLCRIANPNNQPPYWLLGRSDAVGSPYLAFAREYLAWVAAGADGIDTAPSWPLVAYALAYARSLPEAEAAERWRWVDKSPGNERFFARLRRDFPEARIIHVIRRPGDVAASYAALMRRARTEAPRSARLLRDLIASYRLASRHLRHAASGRYRIVQYEQLANDPQAVMAELAAFLEIDAAPVLFRPTVTGRPTTSNSSFPDGNRAAFRPNGVVEHAHLAIARWCHRRLLRQLG